MLRFITVLFGKTTETETNKPERKITMKTATKATATFKSKWGFHPVSYETFLKLKELHKFYYETLRHLGTWVRWNRKTVYRHGLEPKYCPMFVEEKSEWWYHEDADGNLHYRWYPKTRVNRGVIVAYQAARMPKATPEEVQALELTDDEIDKLHAEVTEWFEKNKS